jgi:hypothetical protein
MVYHPSTVTRRTLVSNMILAELVIQLLASHKSLTTTTQQPVNLFRHRLPSVPLVPHILIQAQ